jgi:hypothetical protein
METLATILQQYGKPISLITLCSFTFGFFAFIENMSSPQARTDFARYLKSTDFSKMVVHYLSACSEHVIFLGDA